ncbi:Golgi reassembly-stacking protein 2 [Chionoecetes opilio]|uniref:Golgi reassembly-stacking protein 2 n=1 Tax=Chionoecetes opilio TaxID=41210 RepID=A0A8J5CF66_CHIOP|nr:Golgi reassembly-stacking protein 2 [Chionoecetes opilio]
MGGSQSVAIPGGGTEGYHVLRVQENSPGQLAGLEAFFDFVISIGNTRLDQDNDTLKELLKGSIEKELKMTVYSSKAQTIRTINIVPSNLWGGQGLLGVSIRFCSFEGANENVWHILDVEPNSPADIAGLKGHKDYIIGADSVLHESEDLFSLIEAHEGRPLKLYVYNVETDTCREVTVTPDTQWGGSGSLGCGIGYGYLHRIPTQRSEYIDTPKPSLSETSGSEPVLKCFIHLNFTGASRSDVEALISNVSGISVGGNTPAVATAGSTIPPPTAFTTTSEPHSTFAASTTTATPQAVSSAPPNILPPTTFTPSSLPPPSEIPASFTTPTSHLSSEAPTQIPSQPLVQTAEVPMHPPPVVSPMNPGLPPASLSQPSPLTMGGSPTVPSMPIMNQSFGNVDSTVPMIPLSNAGGMQQSPAVSQYYSSPVVPPPAFTAPPAMPSIPGMPVTTPINLPGMPPITGPSEDHWALGRDTSGGLGAEVKLYAATTPY